MKMILVTITAKKESYGEDYSIKRKDGMNSAAVFITIPKYLSGFCASGYRGILEPIINHDRNSLETLDDFVKAVFKA